MTRPATIRTADVFIESDERAIEGKARQLGKPLLIGLLASAQSLADKEERAADDGEARQPPTTEPNPTTSANARNATLQQNTRNVTTASNASEGSGEWMRDQVREALGVRRHRGTRLQRDQDTDAQRELRLPGADAPRETPESDAADRSAYETYRLDQISHLVGLIPEPLFASVVERLLDGETFSFGAKDRLQFSLIAVQRLEGLLRLPPFEVWRTDRRAHPIAHERYHHDLQRGVLD